MPFISYAQNYEDVLLHRALAEVENGFFIDVGAWHPDQDSVTRAFSERGWRGINIDPLESSLSLFKARRPRDVNLVVFVGERSGTVDFFEIDGTGLSTSDADAAAGYRASGYDVQTRPVTTATLVEICDAYAPGTVHFLKVDCEGSERSVLAGADLKRHRPWIVLVEATLPGTQIPNHHSWEPILLKAGYRFSWFDGLNRFYVASEHFERLHPRLALPPNIFDSILRAADAPRASVPVPPQPDPLLDIPAMCPLVERVALATLCRDCDDLPKVADAGRVLAMPDGGRVQVMHNGLKVEADGYCGSWMTDLISRCGGHHEPQEERLFHEAVEALGPDATMIELGGNWSYYSAWFLRERPSRRAVIVEPDPANRQVGERTMALNGLDAAFVAAIAGPRPAPACEVETERSGTLLLPAVGVAQLMEEHGISHLDMLHCDIQGAELAVLEGCRTLFTEGRIGFVFLSTHSHHISGDPITHARCLRLLIECGAAIEAEHDAYESFSGDGLVVARFGPAPDWTLPVPSRARRTEVLFRDPLVDLALAERARSSARALTERLISGAFEALLLRPIEAGGLASVADHLQTAGDVSAIFPIVLNSPEFAMGRRAFATRYWGDNPSAEIASSVSRRGTPVTCRALHCVLEQDGPLGQAGEALLLPNDQAIFPVVQASGAWNPGMTAFVLERLASEGPYGLLDLGANVGLFSRQLLLASDRFDWCRCAEPDPDNLVALRANLGALPGVDIEISPVALSATNGVLTLYRDTENSGNNSLHLDAMRDRPFTSIEVPVVAAGPWLEARAGRSEPLVWKSDTQGSDEILVDAAPWELWRRVHVAVVELWRIRKGQAIPSGFLDKVADMPNRLIGGRPASPHDVAAYLAGEDWAHEDLYLWRDP